MLELKGKSVFVGIAIGQIKIYEKQQTKVNLDKITDTKAEKERFERARAQAKAELAMLHDKALKEVGETNAMIFEVHQMMLDDLDYIHSITNMIETQKINAEFAVATTGENISGMFAAIEDAYMKERAADVKDISNRVVKILQGDKTQTIQGEAPYILLADDLVPSETVQLDKSKVLSFVTRHGSTNSHTAILAKSMNIPALIGVDFPKIPPQAPRGALAYPETNSSPETNFPKIHPHSLAIVDGYKGILILDPDENTLQKYQNQKEEEEKKKRLLQEYKGKETITRAGRKINLYANIANVADVANVLANDAEGIGLFRSEFLYLESNHLPTEEEQFKAYKAVAETMAGKTVIIRTLDFGADKQVPYLSDYLKMEKEENPAMGYRAIRISLDKKDIFVTQLRAILRASYYGKIAILFPMIISVRELQQIKEIVKEVKLDLFEEDIPFGAVELGAMIETPAAAIISDLIAKEVDFLSVGTNDLTQYTLAIDRQNPKLDSIYEPHHEAVIRQLKTIVDNGHKEGCWVGICGELGADLSMTDTLVAMGFDEISVSPSMILRIREKICNL